MKLNVRQIPRPLRGRLVWLAATLLITIAARVFYYLVIGIRFDASGLGEYYQFVDPELLRHHLLQSIFYLREQPPLFNLYLGVMLKLAPESYSIVFNASYLIAGLLIAASFYWLLTGIGLHEWGAAVLTTCFMNHPTTIVYENWLLYEYPLTALLSIAALALYYFVATGKAWIGHAFFWTLAAIVLTRGTFHFVWFLLVIAGVMILPTVRIRTLVRCSCIPLVIVAAFYIKHYALYGELVSGEVYRKLNYSMMRTAPLPYEELLSLVEQRKISPVSVLPIYHEPITKYAYFLPPFQNTGVPMLDQVEKDSGCCNWHHYAMPKVADLYFRDAQVIDAIHPELYWHDLPDHVRWYFRPANETLALVDPPTDNVKRAAGVIRWANELSAVQVRPGRVGWLTVLLVPLGLAYGLVFSTRGLFTILRRRPLAQADAARLAVVAFSTFTALYISVASILLSYGDHNRYRFSLMPLLLVLIASLGIDLLHAFRHKTAQTRSNPRIEVGSIAAGRAPIGAIANRRGIH